MIAKQIFEERNELKRAEGIVGRERIYFSKDSRKKKDGGIIVYPVLIPRTGYYFDGNISANRTMKIINNLLKVYGYKFSDIKIEYRDNH